ncbi:MAG: RloB family protein [Sulfurovum sp.]|nr:RloB family protein [Sulfurovum sp.]MCB4778968.1 RloB family protein [Sulfurovum sp.]
MARRKGGDKIFQKNKEKEKKDFKRKKNNRAKRDDVIIACEDSVSSRAYFAMIIEKLIKERKITRDSIVIVPHDGSTHPTGVLNNLKNYTNNHGKKYKDFGHKWIVIDRDCEKVNCGGHTAEDFNNALQNAKKKHVDVAYANDAFELWYLLHFEYRNTAISRDKLIETVIEKLKQLDSHKFSKLNRDNIKQDYYTKLIYEALLPKQEYAISNAKNLLLSHGEEHNPEGDNPSTTIHELVTILNNLNS